MLARFLLFAVLLNACAPLVPATAPPQLQHTPGAFVIVTDTRFDAGLFQVDYPKSWRVVKTSIAAAHHLQIVFAAPDGSAITLTQTDATGDDAGNEQYRRLDNGVILQIRLQPADPDSDFAAAAQQLIDTIRS